MSMSRTPFYTTWAGMKQRCLSKNSPNYGNYGGRGITVCEKWLEFSGFKEDMFESYLDHLEIHGQQDTTLERINVDKGYAPDNCCWATVKEQQNNRRVSAKNKFPEFTPEQKEENEKILSSIITVYEAAEILGVTTRQVQRMCKAGKIECRYADGIWLILQQSVKGGTKYHENVVI